MARDRFIYSHFPDLGPVEATASFAVASALEALPAVLARFGVPHAVIGGLAVGAYGFPRYTADVDFLVGTDAYEDISEPGGPRVVVPRPIPRWYNEVPIDLVRVKSNEAFLLDELRLSAQPHVVSPEALVYLKLVAGRPQDRVDIAEVLRAGGASADSVTAYLLQNAPRFLPTWERLLRAIELGEVGLAQRGRGRALRRRRPPRQGPR